MTSRACTERRTGSEAPPPEKGLRVRRRAATPHRTHTRGASSTHARVMTHAHGIASCLLHPPWGCSANAEQKREKRGRPPTPAAAAHAARDRSEQVGLLHDAEELFLVHLSVPVPVGLVDHLLQLLVSHPL